MQTWPSLMMNEPTKCKSSQTKPVVSRMSETCNSPLSIKAQCFLDKMHCDSDEMTAYLRPRCFPAWVASNQNSD